LYFLENNLLKMIKKHVVHVEARSLMFDARETKL